MSPEGLLLFQYQKNSHVEDGKVWIFFPWGCQTKQDFGSEGDQRGSPDLVPVMPMCVFFLGDDEWTKMRMDGRKEGT